MVKSIGLMLEIGQMVLWMGLELSLSQKDQIITIVEVGKKVEVMEMVNVEMMITQLLHCHLLSK